MSDSLGKCFVCGGEACTVYPLLPNSPAFCSEHHNPRGAGPFGCDFTGPDDFDIPDDWPFEFFHKKLPKFSKKAFVWTDKEGGRHKLKDIDDVYLTNIINFLGRRIAALGKESAEYWSAVRSFLLREAKKRDVEVFCG